MPLELLNPTSAGVGRLSIQSCDSGESAVSLAGPDRGFFRPVTMDEQWLLHLRSLTCCRCLQGLRRWFSDKCLSPLVKQRTELKSLTLNPWPQIFHNSILPKWWSFFLPRVCAVAQLYVREAEAQGMGIGVLGCA